MLKEGLSFESQEVKAFSVESLFLFGLRTQEGHWLRPGLKLDQLDELYKNDQVKGHYREFFNLLFPVGDKRLVPTAPMVPRFRLLIVNVKPTGFG